MKTKTLALLAASALLLPLSACGGAETTSPESPSPAASPAISPASPAMSPASPGASPTSPAASPKKP